ncbi:Haloacid dehalogenase-like hydrolase [Anaerobium acetethylicum]|uniref:Haloacid dehalogenase-like hydrolase n=2 Tax=Anaerobium acetethylicum TaxID=1619234 RepID=A0A1D3TV71_9FIRM|nr:Haloacid dehalogenase-like hydrolase [Anaerobium acetethylicum]
MEHSYPFEGYHRTKKYLVCIDSDGCVMDTMDIKHMACFGPCMVAEWNLEADQKEILERWNQINLFSETRGINRFKGLLMALEEIDKKYIPIENLDSLHHWVNTTDELSNASLQREIEKTNSKCLIKALSWSESVNAAVKKIPEEKMLPFKGAEEGIHLAHDICDVAIVSSANQEAVLEEWTKHGLIKAVDILLAQNAGSKEYCIKKLLEYGYEKNHVLMVGDAPGDWDAANRNGVFFYPILAGKEEQSWSDLKEAIVQLIQGTFQGYYQNHLLEQFKSNLE